MDMKMKAALLAPLPHWGLLLVAGASPALLTGTVSRSLMIPVSVVSWTLQIFVFGLIVSKVFPERASGFWEILREYGVKFLIVGLLVGVIAISIQVLLLRPVLSGVHPIYIRGLVRAVFGALIVFVWPLIFLGRSGIGALFSGVLFLMRNIGSSWWIVGMVVIAQLLQVSGFVLFTEHRAGWTFVTLLVSAFLSVYLVTASFSGALYLLVNIRVEDSLVEA
jgi:hypothetical protein|nr:hypothetical protein [Candidatus Krumholzibacteria bacterium]